MSDELLKEHVGSVGPLNPVGPVGPVGPPPVIDALGIHPGTKFTPKSKHFHYYMTYHLILINFHLLNNYLIK